MVATKDDKLIIQLKLLVIKVALLGKAAKLAVLANHAN